jgi:hypothetical protein
VVVVVGVTQTCTAVVALADTGADGLLAGVLGGVALAAAGLVVLLLLVLVRSERRRARALVVLLALAGVAVLALPGPHTASPAQAAASDVDYSAGCTLFTVDEATLVFEPVTANLLPGDDVRAIQAVVENRFAGDIELDADALLGSGPLAGVLEVEVLVDGGAAPVVLGPGARAVVEVHVALAAGVSNVAQAQTVTIDLVFTASER